MKEKILMGIEIVKQPVKIEKNTHSSKEKKNVKTRERE